MYDIHQGLSSKWKAKDIPDESKIKFKENLLAKHFVLSAKIVNTSN